MTKKRFFVGKLTSEAVRKYKSCLTVCEEREYFPLRLADKEMNRKVKSMAKGEREIII